MGALIKFELKKLLANKLALVVNLCAVALVGVMTFSSASGFGVQTPDEVWHRGADAAAAMREMKDPHAGPLTVEKITDDLATYYQEAFSQVDPSELEGLTSGEVNELMRERYGSEAFYRMNDSYLGTLLSPWCTGTEDVFQVLARLTEDDIRSYYSQVGELVQHHVSNGFDTWTLSSAERDFWVQQAAQVPTPFVYGYAAGWSTMCSCAVYLTFAMLAACITIAPIFSREYRTRADAVLLACKNGRGGLAGAKIAAALMYATVLFAVCAACIMGVAGAVLGFDGFDVSYQAYWSVASPTPFTVGQTALVMLGLMYLAMLGFVGLTLAISAATRSQIVAVVTDFTLLFIAGALPVDNIEPLAKVVALFPQTLAAWPQRLFMFSSYELGPVILSMVSMAALVYVVLACASVPSARALWCRHQVG